MIISHNLQAMNVQRNMKINNLNTEKKFNNLSSGFRINKAADDAAGLTMSEKMRGQVKGLDKSSDNILNASNMVRTAEGGMEEITNMIHRIRELSVQAANDINTDEDRYMIQLEIDEIVEEIDRIATDTEFNTIGVLNGLVPSKTGVPVQIYRNNIDTPPTGGGTAIEYFATAAFPTVNNGAFQVGGNPPGLANFVLDDYIKEVWQGPGDLQTFMRNEMYDDYSDASTYNLNSFKLFANTIMDAFNNAIDDINKANETDIPYVMAYVDVDSSGVPYFAMGGMNGDTLTFGGCSPAITGSIGHDFLHMTGSSGQADEEREFRYEFNVQSGANSAQAQLYGIRSMRSAFIGIRGSDVSTHTLAEITIEKCDKSLEIVNKARTNCGAISNRLEHQQSNVENSKENTQAAEALIRDADIAKEMTALAKFQIINQAAQSMLAQANSSPEGILQLLQ